jgi:hypothetical protein
MALHERTQIRNACRAALLNKTPALQGIYFDRHAELSFSPDELPAISIKAGADEVESDSEKTAPRELKHLLDIEIVCALKETDNFVALQDNSIETALDTFAGLIEDLISADDTLGGAASDIVLVSTDPITRGTGDQVVGTLKLNFRATYFRNAPKETPSDIFEIADIRYSLSNAVDEPDQAHDVLNDLYTS